MIETDAYTKAMFGQHARHAAFNYVVQRQDSAGDNRAAIIGNTSFADQMQFAPLKGSAIHTLVLCDVIIRPHLVIQSDHLRGVGAAGILTSSALSSTEEWLEHGKIIINNLPNPLQYERRTHR